MKKFWIRIIVAFIITIAAAYYQTITGPTYELKGSRTIDNQNIEYEFLRSYTSGENQPVEIKVEDRNIEGLVLYRRYKVPEVWTGMKMKREDDMLTALLPSQPPAGKLEYLVVLIKGYDWYSFPSDQTVVTRFKGSVPAWALVPHVFFIFGAMLLSTLTGLEAVVNGKKMFSLTLITASVLFVGGMIFGPIVQKFAFGEFWTGIPFGYDLTDNKTLIAMIFWLIPVFINRKNKVSREWIIVASVVLLLVFSIPHSMFGSELNYETMEIGQGH